MITVDRPLHELDVAELLSGYASGRFDPVAVVEDLLAALASVDHATSGVVTVAADAARRDAAASARRWETGVAGPLDGVSFGVKDNIATAGTRTTLGSERWADWVPERDAESVARLRAAGAVMVAKLATPELAFGDARPGHRPANPWSSEHWTGGSSSGPAVAVASRLLPFALGTDTGGSIRVPSSYCGVTGLKPSLGAVPTDGAAVVSWTLDHVGPIGRRAADLGPVLDVLRGADAHRRADITGIRVGRATGWFVERVAADVLAATDGAVEVLDALGASVTDVEVPDPALGGIAAWVLTVAEFAESNADWRDHLGAYTPAAAERLAAGGAISAGDYLRARRVRRDLRARAARLFTDVDVLVTPGTPTAAPRVVPPLDDLWGDGDRMWLEQVSRSFILFNLLGLPAIVVPAGFSADGRPLSVQVVGPSGADDLVLSVAAAFQAATAHHHAAPSLGSPAAPTSISDAEKGGRMGR